MPNVTFSIDDDLLREAKIAAARTETSVNAVVRLLLSNFVKDVGAKDEGTGNFQQLLDFSLGRITYRTLMDRLDIADQEHLFVMMARAGLPMPSLSEKERAEMSSNFDKVLNAARQAPKM